MRKELLLESARLELVPTSMEIAQADLQNRSELKELLSADIPKSWPPHLVDRAMLEWTVSKLEKDSTYWIWSSRYFILKEPRTLIGLGGFKGSPNAAGLVEIGYSVVPEHQNLGFATEAVKALCDWAFLHPKVTRIVAETYPDLTVSISVLENCEFTYAGTGSEIGVARYELWRRPRR